MLNIELKGLGTAEPAHKLIQSSGWRQNNLLLTSFNWEMLSEFRALDSEAKLGPLTYSEDDGYVPVRFQQSFTVASDGQKAAIATISQISRPRIILVVVPSNWPRPVPRPK